MLGDGERRRELPEPGGSGNIFNELHISAADTTFTVVRVNNGYDLSDSSSEANLNIRYPITVVYPATANI